MSRLVSMLKKEVFSLLVVLPQISVEFAKTAEDAGADAICVRFDSSKDKSELIDIVKAVKIPVGIVFSGGGDISRAQLSALIRLGFDFIEVPMGLAGMLEEVKDGGRIAAIAKDYNIEDIARVTESRIDALDAAIIDPENRGQDMTVGDIQQYITICITSGLPVIVSTQKMIRVSEVPIIWDTGAKAIMLEESMTGDSISAFRSIVSEFKQAVAAVREE